MKEKFFDAGEEAKKKVNERYTKYYEQAKAASDGGKLKLVREQICQPFQGYALEVDKGQVIRFENIDGPQIIDTLYFVRSRPTEEWADQYHTAVMGAMTPMEGMHYYSNTPFTRPLLTFIKDTVDIERIRERHGPTGAHSFVYPSARCTSGIFELAYDVVNHTSCDLNLKQGLMQIFNDEDVKLFHTPAPFMHFQIVNFDKVPLNVTYLPNDDLIKPGDYVELLAHDDLYAVFSPCPFGDQNDTSVLTECVNWPFRVAIYEGADGPLETAPDPHHKTADPFAYNKAGRPGMTVGKVGKAD